MKNLSFLTHYGSVMALIAENPAIRVSDIAASFQLTERAARRLVSDLVEAGYLSKTRRGIFLSYENNTALLDAIAAVKKFECNYTKPLSADVDSKRQQTTELLVNSIETLTRKGFTFWELSVEDIIAEAKISRSTFYLYFKDKATLLEIMLTKIMIEMLEKIKNWNTLVESETQQDLTNFLKVLFKSYQPHRHILSAAIEAGHNHPNISQLYRKYMQQAIDFLTVNITQKTKASAIDTDLSSEWCSTFITWGIEDCLNNIYSNATSKNLDKLAMALAETIWALIATYPPNDNSEVQGA